MGLQEAARAVDEGTRVAGSSLAAPRDDSAAADAAQSGLKALCLIARLHHLAADPATLAHQLGWPASHRPDTDDLLLAAKRIGLKAKRSRCRIDRLKLAALPALAVLKARAAVRRASWCWPSATASGCCSKTRASRQERTARARPSSRWRCSPRNGRAS